MPSRSCRLCRVAGSTAQVSHELWKRGRRVPSPHPCRGPGTCRIYFNGEAALFGRIAMSSTVEADLARKHCVPCEGGVPSLSDRQGRDMLGAIPGWNTIAHDTSLPT